MAKHESCILGVDPGKSGALAVRFADERVLIYDLPYTGRKLNAAAFGGLVRQFAPKFAVVELQGPRPEDGKPQIFAIGTNYGRILGVLEGSGIPCATVSPQRWKRAMGVTADKNTSRARAGQLHPLLAEQFSRVKDDGRAEAALIAYYGSHHSLSFSKVNE